MINHAKFVLDLRRLASAKQPYKQEVSRSNPELDFQQFKEEVIRLALVGDSPKSNRSMIMNLFNKFYTTMQQLLGAECDTENLSNYAVVVFSKLGLALLKELQDGRDVSIVISLEPIKHAQSILTKYMGGIGAKNVSQAWSNVTKAVLTLLQQTQLDFQKSELHAFLKSCVKFRQAAPTTFPQTENFRTDFEFVEHPQDSHTEDTSSRLYELFICSSEIGMQSADFECAAPGEADTDNAFTVAMRQNLREAINSSSQLASSSRDSPQNDFSELCELLQAPSLSLGMQVEELCDVLVMKLDKRRDPREVESEVIDLVGLDHVDIVMKLIQQRNRWCNALEQHKNADRERKRPESTLLYDNSLRTGKAAQPRPNLPNGNAKSNIVDRLLLDPNSVLAEREALELAQRLDREEASARRKETSKAAKAQRYPFVFDRQAEVKETMAFFGGTRLSLPEGTTHVREAMWEAITLPIPRQAPDEVIPVERIQVKDMDTLCQLVLKGIKELNLIQSVVFNAAYNSNENLLISAPTGAGKTNVALLTILQLIKQHLKPGNVVDLSAFKIVYMAPMKALAAEMAANFGRKLSPLGVKVRECTGDMQLSKQELMETQMLVTTPEKWDVITRKGAGDHALVSLVRLVIIDEVHLLHEDRGAVIEALVARMLRMVETSQSMIRIVGLSATLPNYVDVARFLCVNPYRGLFYFDSRFRPVPLGMTFMGVQESRRTQELAMNMACYRQVLEQVRQNEQVMVFVHARAETLRTARWLRENAFTEGHIAHFQPSRSNTSGLNHKKIQKTADSALKELIPDGFATHHAGMIRRDRDLVESMFADGQIRVLVCTATLAWGVNLPAHAVVIKGTRVYDADKSDYVDLDILDVLQIFGRAGRPQFDTLGLATIITTKDKMERYLRLITNQDPIESTLLKSLHDHLNAEIALGTVSNMDEAVTWLGYTYLFLRLRINPMHYGITQAVLEREGNLVEFLVRALKDVATDLDRAEMIRFEPRSGQLASTDRGRTASLYYIKYTTAALVRDELAPSNMEMELLRLLCRATEFSSMKLREDEARELDDIRLDACRLPVGGFDNAAAVASSTSTETAGKSQECAHVEEKVNMLLQCFVSRYRPKTHSLISDMYYIQQNAGRLIRYIFEVSLRRGWSSCASHALTLAKVVERRQWPEDSPLWQFVDDESNALIERVERINLTVDRILDLDIQSLNALLHYEGRRGAEEVFRLAHLLPILSLEVEAQPITRNIVRVKLTLEPRFRWNERWHGAQQSYWIWVEDPDQAYIYHSEQFSLSRKSAKAGQPLSVTFTIPVYEPLPTQYLARVCSDHWLGADTTVPISFKHILLPQLDPPHTDLLTLQPLPINALDNPDYQALYSFDYFNPIQTQLFHTLYHQDVNVLLGAPTGSGKTVVAELAIFRVFNAHPGKKCVYIAPLKALVRERIEDWSEKLGRQLGKRVVELTGDVAPDLANLRRADLIVTTPEKWDGISRSWQQRAYVRQVALIVIDEIHLLGEERGPVLEVLVSRANYIASQTAQQTRLVGLSTALANAPDLAAWLRVPQSVSGRGLFNFRPSVRPVPLEVHIQGFSARHYCPRMATMNRPIFNAILEHSPEKPVLIFVSSRRQTRLTALDLISFLAASSTPKQYLRMKEQDIDILTLSLSDSNLKLTLPYGIGIHHAGLLDRDRRVVEELFVNQRIQVLVATSTLAWGVNFPAHLVIVKGTEYFDGKTKRYVDFPITDVLQMMGRAGRPQFDDSGKAVIMVHDVKKAFYKRFLYEPFPVESCLLQVLPDHMNAEIVAGTIQSMQQALEYLTWTFFFRRLLNNPSFYQLEDVSTEGINNFLSDIVMDAMDALVASSCVTFDADDEDFLFSTDLGKIASFFYLSHKTMRHFVQSFKHDARLEDWLEVLCRAEEFALLPVRHNEDLVNAEFAKEMPLKAIGPPECPHTKTQLLLQAHLCHIGQLPVTDYITDTKSVLDNVPRVLQAMIDVAALYGWTSAVLHCVNLLQMMCQAHWLGDSTLLQLPGLHSGHLCEFREHEHAPCLSHLPQLLHRCRQQGGAELLERILRRCGLSATQKTRLKGVLCTLPIVAIRCSLLGRTPSGGIAKHVDLRNSEKPIDVFFDEEYALSLRLSISNLSLPNAQKIHPRHAYTPGFAKTKEAGWLALLSWADQPSNVRNLICVKRISGCDGASAKLSFSLSSQIVSRIDDLVSINLYLMSDCYLGLDQQLTIKFRPTVNQSLSEEDMLDL